MTRLVKFARRKTAWAEAAENKITVADLQEKEFKNKDGKGPDLTISVYEVGSHEVTVRAYAEHAAAAPIDPPPTTTAMNAAGLCATLRRSAGSDKFEFIRDNHHEIILADINELHALIAEILKEYAHRQDAVRRKEVTGYASSRLRESDPEWLAMLADAQCKTWIRELVSY
jgi:hypothetical protein